MTDFTKPIWLRGVITFVLSYLFVCPAYPCSRVLLNDNEQAVVVGRTMDWFEDMKSNLWVFTRGISRDGGAGKNSLKWTSKYGSLVVSGYEMITVDGINEKGLAVNPL